MKRRKEFVDFKLEIDRSTIIKGKISIPLNIKKIDLKRIHLVLAIMKSGRVKTFEVDDIKFS